MKIKSIKNKVTIFLIVAGLGTMGVTSANSAYPVKVGKQDTNTGCGFMNLFIGGFATVSDQEWEDLNQQIINNHIKHYAPSVYAAKQSFEKAILNPTIENVTESKQSQKALKLITLAGLAQVIIETYDIAQKIVLDEPLTAKEQSIISQSNYSIVAVANELRKRIANQEKQIKQIKQINLDDGIYKGLADNSCNYGIGCNELVAKAHDLYAAQSMNGDYDIAVNQQIINASPSYVFNLALLDKSPNVYQALNDTKNQAYQKAQLSLLTDIDQQLRQLNALNKYSRK